MRKAQLLDRQRQVVGSVTWTPPGEVQVDIADAQLAAAVHALIDRAREKGLPLRSGGPSVHQGKQVFVERTELVPAHDERFLAALVATLNRVSVAGHRLFGVLEPGEERHAGVWPERIGD